MQLFSSQGDLGPTQVCAQGLNPLVALDVAKGKAASRALVQGLVAVVSFQVERFHQLSLVEHDYVWPLLADEPVQVLLLLRGVDASHIPHEDCQGDLLDF